MVTTEDRACLVIAPDLPCPGAVFWSACRWPRRPGWPAPWPAGIPGRGVWSAGPARRAPWPGVAGHDGGGGSAGRG